jgi:hypothetical protein
MRPFSPQARTLAFSNTSVMRASAVGWLMLLVCAANVAWGQTATSKEDEALNTLRVGIPRDGDNPIVDNWVKAELAKVRAVLGTPILIPEAINQFADRFAKQYDHSENTGDFKQKFAERTGAMFAREYAKGAALEEPVGRAMARVLLAMEDIRTRDAVLAGLSTTDQVVRYLSAATLIELQPAVAADGRLSVQMLQAIGAVGAKEINGVVIARLYAACGYEDQPGAAIDAVLAIMNGHLARMRGGMVRELDRTEVPAIEFLGKMLRDGKLPDAARAPTAQALATLLRFHVERYGAEDVGEVERAAIMETVSLTEDLLKALVNPSPAPEVSGKMFEGQPEVAAINMQIELLRWIGSEQDAGILNKAPWNLPVGAP